MVSFQDLMDLAQTVLEEYPIEVNDITIIQGEAIKCVWKVVTPNRSLCLKRLKHTPDKAQFSVEAQQYISSRGGNVPGIIETKDGKSYLSREDQVFVLYDWIDGAQLNFENQSDLTDALRGLARFHLFSQGYQPAEDAIVSSKLGRWPDQYQSMIDRFACWKSTAEKQTGLSYEGYLDTVDPMISLGERALGYLQKSTYLELAAQSNLQSVVLCHQDYGKGNALNTSAGVWVLDLDNVTFELRARDLRKIILKRMDKYGEWSQSVMEEILNAYESAYPLTADERLMVYIDTLFPHSYHGTVKDLFKKNKLVSPSEMHLVSKLEKAKLEILQPLILALLAKSKGAFL